MNLQEKNDGFESEITDVWLANEARRIALEDAEAKRWQAYQEQVHAELLAGPPINKQTLALSDWLTRDIPEPDFLLSAWLTTTSRVLIVGPTGLGKTMFGLAVAFAIKSHKDFLHWTSGRKGRVLYLDGEMSRRLMKRRLIDAARHAGAEPDSLAVLSKEDFDDMPPLNAPEGQKWLDDFLTLHGPFDLVIFDNIQALLAGDMKDEEQWAKVLPWVRSLTRRSIGQCWLHHTGHDESKSYGSKAREWQMDTVILMERVEAAIDLSFALKFTKARERTPENRQDFEPVTMSLQGDVWVQSQSSTQRACGAAKVALDLLKRAVCDAGERPPASNHIPQSGTIRVVPVSLWRRYCYAGTAGERDNAETKRKAFNRASSKLQELGKIGIWDEWVWPI